MYFDLLAAKDREGEGLVCGKYDRNPRVQAGAFCPVGTFCPGYWAAVIRLSFSRRVLRSIPRMDAARVLLPSVDSIICRM